MIRPRRPFARDVVAIDYSYDSSEEWEEDNPGDADDVPDDDDDDEPDAGEDSDADSWLVYDNDNDDDDDNDDDVEAVAPLDEVDATPHPKRRLEGVSGAGTSYKKRKVVRLVPFLRGPVWDPAITKTTEMFIPFRVRFFNGMWLVAQPQSRPLIYGYS